MINLEFVYSTKFIRLVIQDYIRFITYCYKADQLHSPLDGLGRSINYHSSNDLHNNLL